jgi:hypothetical protein
VLSIANCCLRLLRYLFRDRERGRAGVRVRILPNGCPRLYQCSASDKRESPGRRDSALSRKQSLKTLLVLGFRQRERLGGRDSALNCKLLFKTLSLLAPTQRARHCRRHCALSCAIMSIDASQQWHSLSKERENDTEGVRGSRT